MNFLFLINYLKNQSISPNEILVLSEYISRDGFNILSENEFNEMMHYFEEYPQDYEDITPLMTDNNSNYICIYTKGKFKEAICFLSHDEIDLYPKFKNIASLISAINSNPSAWDFFDFPVSAFDYSERKLVE